MSEKPYKELVDVLERAVQRAATGKGLRHVMYNGEPFVDQRILRSARTFGIGSPLGQVAKKAEEIPRLKGTRAKVNECLDIIVYTAAVVIALEEAAQKKETKKIRKQGNEIRNSTRISVRSKATRQIPPPLPSSTEAGRGEMPNDN